MGVFLACPTRGEVTGQVAEALFVLAKRLDTEPRFVFGHLSAGETRTRIVKEFLDTDNEVLLMVDDDVLPSNRVPELLDRLDQWPVLAAAVPIWDLSWPAPAFAALRNNGGWKPVEPTHRGERIVECDAVGTGCIAIRRDVLEAVPDGFNSIREDIAFCEAAKEAGFKVGCDFRVQCDHLARVSLLRVLTTYRS